MTYSKFQCHATCPSHHNSIFYDSHNTWKAVKIIKLPIKIIQPPVTSLILGPNTNISTLFCNTCSLHPAYTIQQDQVYNTYITIRMCMSHLTDKDAYHLCQMTCRRLGGWGHRDGRGREKYQDEDRGCYLLQWQSHTGYPALLYMHAELRSVMMSMPYPMYNSALKPGKVQSHNCISSQNWTNYIFKYKVMWIYKTVTIL